MSYPTLIHNFSTRLKSYQLLFGLIPYGSKIILYILFIDGFIKVELDYKNTYAIRIGIPLKQLLTLE